jgi:AbrB family looped-hinge helix DNA binding protein
MYTSSVTTKGQVTIPAEFRKMFNIQEGKKVLFTVDKKNGGIVVRPLYPIKSVSELPAFGMWKNKKDIQNTETYLRKIREETWGHYTTKKKSK